MAFTWERYEACRQATARMEELIAEADRLAGELRDSRCPVQREDLLVRYQEADRAYWEQRKEVHKRLQDIES